VADFWLCYPFAILVNIVLEGKERGGKSREAQGVKNEFRLKLLKTNDKTNIPPANKRWW
jgi:hypothetical protein